MAVYSMNQREKVIEVLDGNVKEVPKSFLFGMQAKIMMKFVNAYPEMTRKLDSVVWKILSKVPEKDREFLVFLYSQSLSFIHLSAKLGDAIVSYAAPASKYYDINISKKSYTDFFGRVNYVKDYIGWRDETKIPVKDEESLECFEWPTVDDRAALMLKVAKALYPKHFHIGMVTGPYEASHAIVGMVEFLTAIYENPSFVEKVLDGVTKLDVELVKVLGENGADAIIMGDDYGMQERAMFSEDVFSRLFEKRDKKIVKTAKRMGMYAFLHSCGNIEVLLHKIIKCGFDVIHPLQPGAMNTVEVIKKYADVFVPMTGIDVQAIPFMSVEETVKDVLKYINASSGRIIVAPTNAITNDANIENVIAAFRAPELYTT